MKIKKTSVEIAKNIFTKIEPGALFSTGLATDYFILVKYYDDYCEVIELNQGNRQRILNGIKPKITNLYYKNSYFVSCLKNNKTGLL